MPGGVDFSRSVKASEDSYSGNGSAKQHAEHVLRWSNPVSCCGRCFMILVSFPRLGAELRLKKEKQLDILFQGVSRSMM